MLEVRNSADRAVMCVPLLASRSRIVPGSSILYCEHFHVDDDEDAQLAALVALWELTQREPSILGLHLRLFSSRQDRRLWVARWASALNMHPVDEPRGYAKTLIVDLRRSEAELFASFHPTARRHVRAVGKWPVSVRCLTDSAYAPQIDQLARLARLRTGGTHTERDWALQIAQSSRWPSLIRLVGLVADQDQQLLAFACGQRHFDHVLYAQAGSARREQFRLPLAYALVWDLMRWGQQTGASAFDFGGVTASSFQDNADRLGGISDFKRFFRGSEAVVAEEWVYEPSTLQALLARSGSAGSRLGRLALAVVDSAVNVVESGIHRTRDRSSSGEVSGRSSHLSQR
jgi:hypothetical protein